MCNRCLVQATGKAVDDSRLEDGQSLEPMPETQAGAVPHQWLACIRRSGCVGMCVRLSASQQRPQPFPSFQAQAFANGRCSACSERPETFTSLKSRRRVFPYVSTCDRFWGCRCPWSQTWRTQSLPGTAAWNHSASEDLSCTMVFGKEPVPWEQVPCQP